ncbi:MAG: TrmB family transcriptional regulator [Desulfobacterales bacterium]|nr:TrmB family transcriptional regulator [Desulfobacterales bacterium]
MTTQLYSGKLTELGFSNYEASCYTALVSHHPANGSQLSKHSGIARSRIYDVLRNLTRKGLVFEIEQGLYVPLPAEELQKRLRSRFETNLNELENEFQAESRKPNYDYLLSIKGYNNVMAKAKELIRSAKQEIYIRMFPDEAIHLDTDLGKASKRGVGVRYIMMGDVHVIHEIQVIHPHSEGLLNKIGGKSFDLIVDKHEAIAGIFETGKEEESSLIWTRNRWFVIANRDSLRHDFYHYFLDKLYESGESLNPRDKMIYAFIKSDD